MRTLIALLALTLAACHTGPTSCPVPARAITLDAGGGCAAAAPRQDCFGGSAVSSPDGAVTAYDGGCAWLQCPAGEFELECTGPRDDAGIPNGPALQPDPSLHCGDGPSAPPGWPPLLGVPELSFACCPCP